MKISNNTIKKVISVLIIFALLLQFISSFPVYADSFSGTPGYDLSYNITLKPNKELAWTIARQVMETVDEYNDDVDLTWSYNYFHNQVQKKIVNEYSKQIQMISEKPTCHYKIKYPDGATSGRADLSAKIGNETYIWEVKPVVYGLNQVLRKNTFEKQLDRYINSDPLYRNGCKSGHLFSKEEFNSKEMLFKITYEDAGNGLIVYRFDFLWDKIKEAVPATIWSTILYSLYVQLNSIEINYGNNNVNVPIPVSEYATNEEIIKKIAGNAAIDETLNNISDYVCYMNKIRENLEIQKQEKPVDLGDKVYVDAETATIVYNAAMLICEAQNNYGLLNKLADLLFLPEANKTSMAQLYDSALAIKMALGSILVGTGTEAYYLIDKELFDQIADFLEIWTSAKGSVKNKLNGDSIDLSEINWVAVDPSEVKKSIQKYSNEYSEAEKTVPQRDPLIIDLGEDEIELTDVENGVYFDLDNNGFAEKTAWIGTEDGFLALDVNGNGIIDNGGELFGDKFVMPDGNISKTGFEALSSLDENEDGIIDINDSVYENLRVWVDSDHNGITDENELKPLTEYDIESISLNFEHDGTTNIETGTMKAESSYVTLNTVNKLDTSSKYEIRNAATNELLGNTDCFTLKSEDNEYYQLISTATEQELVDNERYKFVSEGDNTYTIYTSAAGNDEVLGGEGTKWILTPKKKISEFWFVINSADTTHNGDSTVGNVPNLEQALVDDESGELLSLYIDFNYADNIAQKRYYLKQILYNITDSADISPDSRGGNIDARDLHVIEAFMGREFNGVDGSNPNSRAAEILKNIYNNIENNYYTIVNFQSAFGQYMCLFPEVEDENGVKSVYTDAYDNYLKAKINNGENVDVLLYDLGNYLKSFDSINGTNEFKKFSDTYSQISVHYSEIVNLINNTYTYIGTYEDDTISTENGNNFIFGQCGDDIYRGNKGNDMYFFDIYHGDDIIYDNQGANSIIFSNELSTEDYDFSVSANNGFVLTNKYTGNSISLPHFITNPLNYKFIFENLSQTENPLENREIIEGTDGDDTLEAGDGFNIFYGGNGYDTIEGGANIDFMYGGEGNDTLLGRNGTNIMFGESGDDVIYDGDDSSYLNGGDDNDMLYGGGGADVLDGGAGNDYLQGDHGNDTYVFGKGYDVDTVAASSDLHTIIIHNYRVSDMNNIRETNNDLVINFGNNTGDTLIVSAFFDYNSNRDYNFIFDDGTILGQYDIVAKTAPIVGTESDDYLFGTNEADTIDGIEGNDNLCGGNGEDTYIFGKGYAQDTINEWGSDHSYIELKDINSDEVTVSDQWGSNLVVSVNDTEDILTISNFKWGQATYTFKFADGAEGYVDKNTWQLILTKQPDTIENEIVNLVS